VRISPEAHQTQIVDRRRMHPDAAFTGAPAVSISPPFSIGLQFGGSHAR
jgi:hypothetical protein